MIKSANNAMRYSGRLQAPNQCQSLKRVSNYGYRLVVVQPKNIKLCLGWQMLAHRAPLVQSL